MYLIYNKCISFRMFFLSTISIVHICYQWMLFCLLLIQLNSIVIIAHISLKSQKTVQFMMVKLYCLYFISILYITYFYLVTEDQKSDSENNFERWNPDLSINIPSHEELMAIKRKKKV